MADLGNPLFLSSHPVLWLGNGALSPKSEYLRFRQRNDQVLSGTGCARFYAFESLIAIDGVTCLELKGAIKRLSAY